MLHFEAVESNTISILNKLQNLPSLKSYQLVGGTALSLHFGHRKSDDLDLFSNSAFNSSLIISDIVETFGNQVSIKEINVEFGIFCYIHSIKVDLIYYNHQIIRPNVLIEGIRMNSMEDIIAMKIQAILGRANKKDFWDIAELLDYFTLDQMIGFHKEKFPNQFLAITIPQALTFFEEANNSVDPISLKNQTWEEIKLKINSKIREYLKI